METPQSPFQRIPEGESAESIRDLLQGQEVLDDGGNLVGTVQDVHFDKDKRAIKSVVLSDDTEYPAQRLTFASGELYLDRAAPASEEPVLPSEGERLPNEEIAADMEGYVRDDRAARDSGRMTQKHDEIGTDELPDMDFEPTRPVDERKASDSTERRTYEEVEEEIRDKFESTPGELGEQDLPDPNERRGYDRSEEE